MNVSLTPELEARVRALVETGRYGSSSEVVRAGLRNLFEEESERVARRRAVAAETFGKEAERDEERLEVALS